LVFQRDWVGARRDIDKALELAPRSSDVQRRFATLCMATGDIDGGVAAARCSIQIDPLDVHGWLWLGLGLTRLERFDEAIESLRKAVAVSPASSRAIDFLSMAQLYAGRMSDSLATALTQSIEPWRLMQLAMINHSVGDAHQSDALLMQLTQHFAERAPMRIGGVFGWKGDLDSAFYWYNRAVDQSDPEMVFLQAVYLAPAVRQDQRYTLLLQRLGLVP
jgi:tetratricopeptide (TPR) repeat protein